MTNHLKQIFHLEPDRGLLNDPNGLAKFNNKYYVFFQWNRFEKNHTYKEWGYFTSEDMVSWEFMQSALIPDREEDRDGVYSGSGVVIDDKLYLYYTGNHKENGVRTSRQCLATTTDGRKFFKTDLGIRTPQGYTEHFRDPKVFKYKNGYYMIVGSQRDNKLGSIALFRSNDGMNWTYQNMLAYTDAYQMVECPDLFNVDGQDILVYCMQRCNSETDEVYEAFTVYVPVHFDEETGILEKQCYDGEYIRMDSGFDFYAPQTFLNDDGRRIVYAWMSRLSDEQEKILADNSPSLHCLTMPRELSYKNGRLCQKPVSELYRLLGDQIPAINLDDEYHIEYDKRVFWLKIAHVTIEDRLVIALNQKEISIEIEDNQMSFKRLDWSNGNYEEKAIRLDKTESIEIWMDNSSIEVFVNDGEAVFSARILPTCMASEIHITGLNAKSSLEVRQIKEINKKEKESE